MLINIKAVKSLLKEHNKRCSKEYIEGLNHFLYGKVLRHVEATRCFKTIKADVFLGIPPKEKG